MRRVRSEKCGRMEVDYVDIARFWSKVAVKMTNSVEKSCWVWNGRKHRNYGQFQLNGVCRYAPRVAWLIAYGTDPGDLAVLHNCDNPPCVNPKHLFLGNAQDNTNDCIQKGRFHRGENTGGAVLTEDDVRRIRQTHVHGVIGSVRVARVLGLSASAVAGVIHNNNWAWVE